MPFSLLSRKVVKNLAIPVLLLNSVAAVTVAITLVKGQHLSAFIAAAITWVITLRMSGVIMQLKKRTSAALGRNLIARIFLIITALIWAMSSSDFTALVVLGNLLMLSTLSEPILKRLLRSTYSRTANFPESRLTSSPKIASLVSFTHQITLAVFLITTATSVSPMIFYVTIVLMVGLQAFCISKALIEIRHRHRHPVADQIAQFSPQFLIYWDAPRGASYQVSMWLPYLERVGARFMLVTRSQTNFNELKRITDRPIVLRQTLAELDDVVVPSVNAVFYVNNAARNSQMVRYYNLTHIQLLHGDSDKASSFNPVLRMYDFHFVAGRAAIDRFSRNGISMPPEIFRIVGRPQVESVLSATNDIAEVSTPTVLYAPTWAGFFQDTNYSSLPWGLEVIKSLVARGCVVIFRPHPYTTRNPELAKIRKQIIDFLDEDRQSSGRQHLFGDIAETTLSVFDCFNQSHAMISDVSAVVGDYLFSGKPYVLTNISHTVEDFLTEFPMSQGSYLWCPPNDLTEVLDVLLGSDPLQSKRLELRDYYLGDFPLDGYSENFITAVREVISDNSLDAELSTDSPTHEPALEPILDLEAP